MIMSGYIALLAEGEEGWIKLVVPVVIGIFYIISAIAKGKAGNEENAANKQGTGRPQKLPMQPGRTPQRPVPRRYAERPGPAPGSQRPKDTAGRVVKPMPIARPVSPGKLEYNLIEKPPRLQVPDLVGAIPIEKPAAAAIAPQVPPPVEVQKVTTVGQTALGRLEARLRDPATLREAIILREILDRPLALRA
jgi:hypothetical protein